MTLRRVGLFGGSFNPPHNGHVSAARRVLDTLAPDSLVIMPAGHPPHKEFPPGTPSPDDRLTMTKLAFAAWPKCEVSDWEMCNPAPGYTADTLDRMRSGRCQLILIVGTDMFLTLHEWARAAELLAVTRVAVLARAGGQDSAISRQGAFLAHRYGAAIEWIPHEPVEISSTELRAMLRSGHGREFLPEAVYEYILEKRLYGVE